MAPIGELKAAGKPGGATCDPAVLRASEKASRKELHYNLDARILQDVLSSEPGGLFVAFVHGKHYDGKTLLVIDPHGAPSVEPEEIKLETYNESKLGIWAAFHYNSEYANGTASSAQKNGVIHIDHQKLDTDIEKERAADGQSHHYDGCPCSPACRRCNSRSSHRCVYQALPDRTASSSISCRGTNWRTPQFWVILPKSSAKGEQYAIRLQITLGPTP